MGSNEWEQFKAEQSWNSLGNLGGGSAGQSIFSRAQAQASQQYTVSYPQATFDPIDDWVRKYGQKCQKKHKARLAKKEEEIEQGEGFVINNFLLGCDPEFVALDVNGRTMHLDLHEEEIGIDHGGRVGEFRPKPCKGAFALTKRLQRLILSRPIENIRASRLRGGARVNDESLGGHVHFGFKNPVQEEVEYFVRPDGTQSARVKQKGDDLIIRALDKVTGILEHLDILPKNESENRRKGTYGKYGDVRDSGGHMEYRSMCSWLHDPKVAFLCLTAAKLAAADPEGTLDGLTKVTSFEGLKKWIGLYKTKDSNASRTLEKIREHKLVQVDPGLDFRERWRTLGL